MAWQGSEPRASLKMVDRDSGSLVHSFSRLGQDHEIPEARAPCEVPLLEKDWQKYGNGKNDQSHLWWGVNLSASDR